MAWQIDLSHSSVQFSARHLMVSKVRGQFHQFSGTVEVDEQNPTLSKVVVEIDANSLDTRDEKRDGHLKSPDFLDVATYPTLTFVSSSVEQISESELKVHGDLTIRGVSKPVTLNVEYNGTSKAPWGVVSAGFTATTKINREDWGLTWNMALETGGVLVGKEIEIAIEVELMQVAEPVAEAAA